ncbi:MAG: 50S ribosomal protein L25/general stress protein Ctc [Oxalobacter sp.]|jgi:large subunit ribosomal protein L25|nr:50S ribosomal protein L25/general stress protein Ctc [Oxalobacter sp.]
MKVVASARAEVGTGASRRLRTAGRAPGIVYGGNEAPVNITVDHNELFYALKKEEFHSSILDLEIDGKVEKVLLRDFQPHAYKPLILHVDFLRVDPNQPITVKVPLHFTNEDASPAAKAGGLHRAASDLEISCLPANLPAFIEVDLSGIAIGQSIHLKDLKLPEGVKAVSHDASLAIVTTEEVAAPAEESEGEAAPAEA